MSVSRRGLFGLFGGAAAAAVIPKVAQAHHGQQLTIIVPPAYRVRGGIIEYVELRIAEQERLFLEEMRRARPRK